MAQISVGFPVTAAGEASPTRRRPLSPAMLRTLLVAAPLIALGLGYSVTRGAEATRAAMDAGAELTRLLRLMALLKCVLGAGALALVAVRFRFPVTSRLAFAYIAAGTVMASGPGVMWNMAYIGLGALLLHGGLAAMFVLAWFDDGKRGLRTAR